MEKQLALITGLIAFIEGRFLEALRWVYPHDAPAAALLAQAVRFHENLHTEEGPFLFPQVAVLHTQRRYWAVVENIRRHL